MLGWKALIPFLPRFCLPVTFVHKLIISAYFGFLALTHTHPSWVTVHLYEYTHAKITRKVLYLWIMPTVGTKFLDIDFCGKQKRNKMGGEGFTL